MKLVRSITALVVALLLCLGAVPAAAVTCGGLRVTITGTNGADELTGTPRRDVIAGLGGDDELEGGSGEDFLSGGDGSDKADGGGGHDTCSAETVVNCETAAQEPGRA